MDESTKKSVKRRIASAAGHLKGIGRMVDEDTDCIDIIHQVRAVQAALNKINSLILEQHLERCITNAIREENENERAKMLAEITKLFETKAKL